MDYGYYEPDDLEKIYVEELLERKSSNAETAKEIAEHLVHTAKSRYKYNKNDYETIEEIEKALGYITEQRLNYIKNNFEEVDGHSSSINDFFVSLFEKYSLYNSKELQAIAALDNTKFVVKVNNGEPITKSFNPLVYVSTAFGVSDDDITKADREAKRRQKDVSIDDMANELPDDSAKSFLLFEDERLSNYIYLDDEQKEIFGLIYKGLTKTAIQNELGLTPTKLNTKIKHIAEQLENPVRIVSNIQKTCSVCGIEKPIIEFTKDKQKKDGYSCRCKQCDRERKQKNKNSLVGKMKKTA